MKYILVLIGFVCAALSCVNTIMVMSVPSVLVGGIGLTTVLGATMLLLSMCEELQEVGK